MKHPVTDLKRQWFSVDIPPQLEGLPIHLEKNDHKIKECPQPYAVVLISVVDMPLSS